MAYITETYVFGSAGFGDGPYGGGSSYVQLPVGYYLNLLTSEYRVEPNLVAWLTAPLSLLDDLTAMLPDIPPAFDITLAVGPQLDILGELIGQSRTVGFQPSAGISPTLDDTTYRLLLQCCIAKNQWDGTIDSMQPIWQSLFPGGRINFLDGQDMAVTIVLTGVFTSIIQDLIVHGYMIPESETVQYTYTFGTFPTFGFDQDNVLVGGFDHGHWS
jgi:Protein of unknown function (DUF2612)